MYRGVDPFKEDCKLLQNLGGISVSLYVPTMEKGQVYSLFYLKDWNQGEDLCHAWNN